MDVYGKSQTRRRIIPIKRNPKELIHIDSTIYSQGAEELVVG